jgi:hypothetical protein
MRGIIIKISLCIHKYISSGLKQTDEFQLIEFTFLTLVVYGSVEMCETIQDVPRVVRHSSCCYDQSHIPHRTPLYPHYIVWYLYIRHFQCRKQGVCRIAMLV